MEQQRPPQGSRDAERRRAWRQRVVKRARLLLEGAEVDCVALDVSDQGVRVQLGSHAYVPEVVAITLFDGSTHLARRRWMRGSEIGFEFTVPASRDSQEPTARGAWMALKAVKAASPGGWLPLLKGQGFLSDPALREAAEAAEAAHRRLEAALSRHVLHEQPNPDASD